MNPILYLHVGLPKTGTTSIQYFLAQNKELLAEDGLIYPELFGQIKKTLKNKKGSGNALSLSRILANTKNNKLETSRKKALDLLEVKLEKAGQNHVLLSSEGLWDLTEKQHQKLADIAKSKGFTCKIIIYLRRQDLALLSIYNQKVKRHLQNKSLQEWLDIQIVNQEPRLKYYSLLERMASVFGKQNIIPRVFENSQLKNNNLIEDFLSCMDFTLKAKYNLQSDNQNEAMSSKSTALLSKLNVLNPSKGFATYIVQAESTSKANATIFQDKIQLPKAMATKILNHYEDENKKVAIEYFNRTNGQLFFDTLKENNSNNEIEFNSKELSALLGGILLQFDSQNNKHSKKLETLLQAKRAAKIAKTQGQ